MIGYGLPVWIDERVYLTADEVRALGEIDLFLSPPWGSCAMCGIGGVPLDPAHIVRQGLGGKPDKTSGPTVRTCRPCHNRLDGCSDMTYAIKRPDRMGWYEVVLLKSVGPAGVIGRRRRIEEKRLGETGLWIKPRGEDV